MSLFDVFKKKPEPPTFREYTYITAKHFRGFHKFAMAVHGDSEAEKNNLKFRGKDVIGHPLVFRDISPTATIVLLDGLKIGTIYDEDELRTIRTNRITDVYVKFEEDTIIGSDKVEKRFRAHLIIKEKE